MWFLNFFFLNNLSIPYIFGYTVQTGKKNLLQVLILILEFNPLIRVIYVEIT